MSISAQDVEAALGRVEDLLLHELIRTEATVLEFRRAVRLVRSRASDNPDGYDALPPRLRRLVDLCAVAASMPPERFAEPEVRSDAA